MTAVSDGVWSLAFPVLAQMDPAVLQEVSRLNLPPENVLAVAEAVLESTGGRLTPQAGREASKHASDQYGESLTGLARQLAEADGRASLVQFGLSQIVPT